MAAELPADLVVMVATLYGDQLRAARVCRAWSHALADVPRLVYDSRVRMPTLDAARRYEWIGRQPYDVRSKFTHIDAPALRNLFKGCQQFRRCVREVRAPNAWELRGHVRPLTRSQVNRMLREATLGARRATPPAPRPPSGPWPAARVSPAPRPRRLHDDDTLDAPRH